MSIKSALKPFFKPFIHVKDSYNEWKRERKYQRWMKDRREWFQNYPPSVKNWYKKLHRYYSEDNEIKGYLERYAKENGIDLSE